jgi:hypothetical protein
LHLQIDSLIDKASGELLLPHLNPEHWCLFYNCISPDNNGACLSENDGYDSMNRSERMKYLVPFFKEFGMNNYLNISSDVDLLAPIVQLSFRLRNSNL